MAAFVTKGGVLRFLVATAVLANLCCQSLGSLQDFDLKVVTVATEETDGYKRFIRSAKVYNLSVEVYGLNQEWLGGDMARGPGGGHKIQILRTALEKYKTAKDTILMFTDSYDVIFAGDKSEILQRFENSGANVLISAEDFCWPDRSLESRFNTAASEGYRYLCSGGIIGYAPAVYEILTLKSVKATDDDQLYYTHIYLDHAKKYNIKLDRKADLFQNLNGNQDHVELEFDGPNVKVVNTRYKTSPVVLHGNGPSKLYLNHLGNYVPNMWTHQDGCLSCDENKINLASIPRTQWPTVLIGLFVTLPTPFVDSFMLHIGNMDYPKEKIDLFVYNSVDLHSKDIESWITESKDKYRSIQYEGPKSFLTEQQGRDMGIFHSRKVKCQYYFSVDATASLTNRKTMQLLIEQNKGFLTPMLSKYEKYWTNFWGSIDKDGYYARAADYLDIVKNVRRSVWNVPFVNEVYLMNSATVDKIGINPYNGDQFESPDIQFCANLRDKGVLMYVTNLVHFGHLKETETYNTTQMHNDMYQMMSNKLDWEDKYLHPDFNMYLNPETEVPQPCQDVYWVPTFTKNFTDALIEECENFGEWSGGGHKDERIAGGYENVPTVDIHMKQLNFEENWIDILKVYYAPMATRLFTGYYSKSEAYMNFVVKYTPAGQYFLRPHHDASTYTVNLALNKRGVDYQGGGARFIRYNCSIADTQVGWSLLHPGRLTHQHEGLETTQGTRYIMISFVDP